MKTIRLQGKQFQSMKLSLTAISYSESTNGHIRVEYKGYKGQRYCHWLNPEEIAIFDKTSLPITVWKAKRRQT